MRKFKRILKRLGKGLLIIVLLAAVVHGIATFVLGRMVESEISKVKARGEPVSLADLGKETVPDSENAAVVYERIFSRWPDPCPKYTPYGFDILSADERKKPHTWDEARRIAALGKNDLALVEVAVERPRCKFQVDWLQGPTTKFPHLPRMRVLTRLVSTRAVLSARDGRMDDAAHWIEVCFKLSNSIRDEPCFTSWAVRCAIVNISSSTLRGVADCGSISEPQARKLFDALPKINLNGGFAKAMLGERVNGIHMFEQYRKYTAYLSRPLLYADELRFLRVMDMCVRASSQPSRASVWRSQIPKSAATPTYPFGGLADVYCRAREVTDKAVAELSGSRVFLAVHAYKSRFGEYPATLNNVNAKLGWKLPEDPFTGRGFIYRRQGRGFLLYSIGPDIKDGGGAEMVGWEGDVVWKMER